MEVIYGILNAKKITIEEFEEIRKNKVKERGAFQEKIFLEKILQNGE